jgi:dynein heavy chain, axonemal
MLYIILLILLLLLFLERIPYDAMKYLIAEANYGGRVTDDWDRRLVNVYISELICDEVVHTDNYLLSELPGMLSIYIYIYIYNLY